MKKNTSNDSWKGNLSSPMSPQYAVWRRRLDGSYEGYITTYNEEVDRYYGLDDPVEVISEKEYFKRKLEGTIKDEE